MITVRYELVDPKKIEGADIDVQEDRGSIVIKIGRHLTVEQIVSALNEMSKAILAGGHWFQEWKGDIITVDSPGADDAPPTPGPGPNLYDDNDPHSDAA